MLVVETYGPFSREMEYFCEGGRPSGDEPPGPPMLFVSKEGSLKNLTKPVYFPLLLPSDCLFLGSPLFRIPSAFKGSFCLEQKRK